MQAVEQLTAALLPAFTVAASSAAAYIVLDGTCNQQLRTRLAVCSVLVLLGCVPWSLLPSFVLAPLQLVLGGPLSAWLLSQVLLAARQACKPHAQQQHSTAGLVGENGMPATVLLQPQVIEVMMGVCALIFGSIGKSTAAGVALSVAACTLVGQQWGSSCVSCAAQHSATCLVGHRPDLSQTSGLRGGMQGQQGVITVLRIVPWVRAAHTLVCCMAGCGVLGPTGGSPAAAPAVLWAIVSSASLLVVPQVLFLLLLTLEGHAAGLSTANGHTDTEHDKAPMGVQTSPPSAKQRDGASPAATANGTGAAASVAGTAALAASQPCSWQQVVTCLQSHAGDLSHDLKNPLNGILALSQTVMQGAMGEIPKAAVDQLAVVRACAYQLLNMACMMKDMLIGLHCGQLAAAQDVFALAPNVTEALSRLKPMTAPNLQLNVDVDPQHQVVAQPDKLYQMLHVIIANTLKYTRRGSVTLSSEMRDNDQYCVFRSVDTGSGFPPAQLEKVTMPLKGDASEELGLGLMMVRRFAAAWGGKVNVFNNADVQAGTRGCTVELVLRAKLSAPMLQQLPQMPATVPHQHNQPGQPGQLSWPSPSHTPRSSYAGGVYTPSPLGSAAQQARNQALR